MSNGYQNVTIALLSKENLSLRSAANCFLSTLVQFPVFAPKFCGNFEPVQTSFMGIEQALADWGDPFLWKSNRSQFAGSAWSGRGKQHSAVYLQGSLQHLDFEKTLSFLTRCAEALHADFGYLHLTTEAELHGGCVPYKIAYAMDVGVTSHDLRRGIPNLAWVTIFGAPYQEFVKPKVASAQFEFIQLSSSTSMLRLRSSAEQIVHGFATFNRVREAAKKEIGGDLFWRADLSGATTVPTFDFGSRADQS